MQFFPSRPECPHEGATTFGKTTLGRTAPGKATESITRLRTGNTKGESITVPLTSCLTGLESAV